VNKPSVSGVRGTSGGQPLSTDLLSYLEDWWGVENKQYYLAVATPRLIGRSSSCWVAIRYSSPRLDAQQ